jgi:hypothetical protein
MEPDRWVGDRELEEVWDIATRNNTRVTLQGLIMAILLVPMVSGGEDIPVAADVVHAGAEDRAEAGGAVADRTETATIHHPHIIHHLTTSKPGAYGVVQRQAYTACQTA